MTDKIKKSIQAKVMMKLSKINNKVKTPPPPKKPKIRKPKVNEDDSTEYESEKEEPPRFVTNQHSLPGHVKMMAEWDSNLSKFVPSGAFMPVDTEKYAEEMR